MTEAEVTAAVSAGTIEPAKKEEAAKIPAPTIKVSSAPKGKHKKTTAEIQKDRREWVAKHRAEQKDMLQKAGYTDVAIIQIMKYASGHAGYEKKRAKDHLILMFVSLANDLRYRMPKFDRDLSAKLVVGLIDANGKLPARLSHNHLTPSDVLVGKTDEEKQKIAQAAVQSSLGNSDDGKALAKAVCFAVNNKFAEGYAERLKFFCDAAVDCSMKCVDPFEGMFHDSPLKAPEWMHAKKAFVPKGKPCPKCGKPMQHVFKTNKDFCLNPLCEAYAPPPEKKAAPEKISTQHDHNYTSGKRIEQTSAADKFRQRYGKKPMTAEQKAKAEKRAAVQAGIKDLKQKADKFSKDASAGVWGALDALKLGDTPANTEVPTAPAAQS